MSGTHRTHTPLPVDAQPSMIRFKVTFDAPKRTYYIRAKDPYDAFLKAKEIEQIYEMPARPRARSMSKSHVDALQHEETDS